MVLAMIGPAVRRSGLAMLLAVAASGCASAPPPEQALAGVSESGEVVPLDSLTTSFESGGITVIHRIAPASDIVAVNLYLLGGSRQLTERTAGIETLLLGAAEYGTKHYPGDRTRRAQGLTGSRFMVEPQADWTVFGFHGLTTELDSSWAVFADRIMHPTLDSAAVEVVRGRMVTAVRARQNSPDGLVQRLADSIAFGAHAYALPPHGTERALLALAPQDLRRYHAEQMVTSRMLLVVVGDASRARLEQLIGRTLATLPRGTYRWEPPPSWAEGASAVAVHERQLPTNYIYGYFAGPPPSDRDYAAFRLATALLGAQIHSRIREEGLSYAAYAPFLERGAPVGGIYVSTAVPDRAMRVINDVIAELRRVTLTRRSLSFFSEQFIMDYFQENATSVAQADFLARAHLYRGDWRSASQYMAELRRVSPSAVRGAMTRYVRDIRYGYLGDPTRVPTDQLTRW